MNKSMIPPEAGKQLSLTNDQWKKTENIIQKESVIWSQIAQIWIAVGARHAVPKNEKNSAKRNKKNTGYRRQKKTVKS